MLGISQESRAQREGSSVLSTDTLRYRGQSQKGTKTKSPSTHSNFVGYSVFTSVKWPRRNA